MPIRAGSSGCGSRRERSAPRRAPSARAGAARLRRMAASRRPATRPPRRQATGPVRSEPGPAISPDRACHHPDLGMEARARRDGCRCALGAGAGAVQRLPGAVHHFPGAGLADRRRRRRTISRRPRRGADRLLVWARLFRARPLLDRLRLLRRRRCIRLADAVRRAGPAGLSVDLHGNGLCARPPALDQERDARACARGKPHHHGMAAGSCADRLSLERVRLCVVRAAAAGTDGVADRPVGHDVPDGCDLRKPRGADGPHAPSPPGPAALIDRTRPRRLAWRAPAAALALLLVMGIFGAIRLSLHPPTMVAGTKLRLMQPNLQQDAKFNYAAKAEVMKKYLALSDRASGPQSTGVRDATILIWPESAFPFFLTREADAMAQIAELLPKGTVLITGSVRAPDLPRGTPITRAYNSIYVIDHDGSVLSMYDKLHLVPFGEFLPYQGLMEKLGFEQLTRVRGGFIAGTVRHALAVPGAPSALPLI